MGWGGLVVLCRNQRRSCISNLCHSSVSKSTEQGVHYSGAVCPADPHAEEIRMATVTTMDGFPSTRPLSPHLRVSLSAYGHLDALGRPHLGASMPSGALPHSPRHLPRLGCHFLLVHGKQLAPAHQELASDHRAVDHAA